MSHTKIIFIGPVGAGKTSAIRAISEIECVDTEEKISDTASGHKKMTTVALDYGLMTLANGVKAHLYGAPGQSRFDFVWDILSKQIAQDASTVVLMLDNARECPQEDLRYYVETFAHLIAGKKLLLGITRSDVQASPAVDDYRGWLKALSVDADVHLVDARDRRSVLDMVTPSLAVMAGTALAGGQAVAAAAY